MKAGLVVYFFPYMGRFNPWAYYMRGDTSKKCTRDAEGLICRGLAQLTNERHAKLQLTDDGRRYETK